VAKLSEETQTFIVQRLAMFDSPSKVAALVKEEFAIEVSRQQVESYNPLRLGKKPAEKWIAVHAETRKKYLEDVASTPASAKAVRIAQLEKLALRMIDKGDEQRGPIVAKQCYDAAASYYEQIAKEVGEVFTNSRNIHASGDAKVVAALLGLTPEQVGAALSEDGPGDISTATDGGPE
jgi:hypothetical protein